MKVTLHLPGSQEEHLRSWLVSGLGLVIEEK